MGSRKLLVVALIVLTLVTAFFGETSAYRNLKFSRTGFTRPVFRFFKTSFFSKSNLIAANPPLPLCIAADITGDSRVDGADLAIWQQQYNALGDPPCGCSNDYCNRADINRDSRVDGADLALWQQNYDALGSIPCILPDLGC